jgi:hypothetical protein
MKSCRVGKGHVLECGVVARVVVVIIFCVTVLSGGDVFAGRPYVFDAKSMCEAVDKAQTWKELVPTLKDLLKLHIYSAERMKPEPYYDEDRDKLSRLSKEEQNKLFRIQSYEYFQRDWDEPLVAAGKDKGAFSVLATEIDKLSAASLSRIACYMDSGKPDKTRLDMLDMLLRKYLQVIARVPSQRHGSLEKCVDCFCTGSTVGVANGAAVQQDVVSKDYLHSVANEVWWLSELGSGGKCSFMKYLVCCKEMERSVVIGREDLCKMENFCCALALLVSEHLDRYGVVSSLTDEGQQEDLKSVKKIIQDSVCRFHTLLSISFVRIEQEVDRDGQETGGGGEGAFAAKTGEKRVVPLSEEEPFKLRLGERFYPMLKELGWRQKVNRESFASCCLSCLKAKGERQPTPRYKTPVSSDSCQKASAEKPCAKELWERYELIDELVWVGLSDDFVVVVGEGEC